MNSPLESPLPFVNFTHEPFSSFIIFEYKNYLSLRFQRWVTLLSNHWNLFFCVLCAPSRLKSVIETSHHSAKTAPARVRVKRAGMG